MEEVRANLQSVFGDSVYFDYHNFYLPDVYGDVTYSAVILTTEHIATLVLLYIQSGSL